MNEHGGLTNRRNGADDQLMTIEEVGAYLQSSKRSPSNGRVLPLHNSDDKPARN